MSEITGDESGAGLKIAVIVSRWNQFITRKLLEGTLSTLGECGVAHDDVTTAWVPGAFEVPLAAKWAAAGGRYDAIICLGCVIRGETSHYEYVAGAAAEGILRVSQDSSTPVIFGVLTVDSVDQALARAGGKEGHKGEEAARSAIEMATLRAKLA
jgi:6,7-dimethyl-8-ribityllumazine synthase